jgi:hypothetical protein
VKSPRHGAIHVAIQIKLRKVQSLAQATGPARGTYGLLTVAVRLPFRRLKRMAEKAMLLQIKEDRPKQTEFAFGRQHAISQSVNTSLQ